MIILVGYHSTSGYKLFHDVNRRTMIIWDVVGDEMKQVEQLLTGYE